MTDQDYEQTILTALHQLPPAIHDGVTVQTPHLYNFSSSENTQIYSDLPSSTELKTYVLTHTLTQAQCSRLGQSIGLWAKQFHSWAAATEQEKLREAMKGTAMKELKYSINYPQMVANIAKFPAILEGSSSVLEDVANDTKASMDREEGQIIHGDFWSGKQATYPLKPMMHMLRLVASYSQTPRFLPQMSPSNYSSSIGSSVTWAPSPSTLVKCLQSFSS